MNEQAETITISNRDDFSRWAIERAAEIVTEQGGQLVAAAQKQGDEQIWEEEK